MLLLCLFFLPPVWANDDLYGEVPYEMQPDFVQEQIQEYQAPPEPLHEEVLLFTQEETDNSGTPYNYYDRNAKSRNVLKGGVEFKDNRPKTVISKDGSSLKVQKGKHEVFAISGRPANGNEEFAWGYHRGRFSILHSYERAAFRPELARNNSALESELQLTKNLKFRTTFRTVQGEKSYTQGAVLEYGKKDSRFKKVNNLKFELKASTTINPDAEPVKRFGFNTRYYF